MPVKPKLGLGGEPSPATPQQQTHIETLKAQADYSKFLMGFALTVAIASLAGLGSLFFTLYSCRNDVYDLREKALVEKEAILSKAQHNGLTATPPDPQTTSSHSKER